MGWGRSPRVFWEWSVPLSIGPMARARAMMGAAGFVLLLAALAVTARASTGASRAAARADLRVTIPRATLDGDRLRAVFVVSNSGARRAPRSSARIELRRSDAKR